jgi:hypothetical protein
MQVNTFLKQLLFSTVRIIADTDIAVKKNVGTGFLVVKKISENKGVRYLLSNQYEKNILSQGLLISRSRSC